MAVAAIPGPAVAAVAILDAVRDNTLYEQADGLLSNGAGDYLFAGRTNHPPGSADNPTDRRGLLRRALVAFDVESALPAGAIVVAASLRLHVSNVSLLVEPSDLPVDVSLHRVLAGWGEGASNAVQQEGAGAVAQPGDATWTHSFLDEVPWMEAGGDFAEAATATLEVGDKFAFYAWEGAGLVADVQSWLDAPASDAGWIVIGDESAPLTAKRFNSRSHPDAATRPRLTVEYRVVPEPGAAGLLLLALALGTFAIRRRA